VYVVVSGLGTVADICPACEPSIIIASMMVTCVIRFISFLY
jgi:hypothetical protein